MRINYLNILWNFTKKNVKKKWIRSEFYCISCRVQGAFTRSSLIINDLTGCHDGTLGRPLGLDMCCMDCGFPHSIKLWSSRLVEGVRQHMKCTQFSTSVSRNTKWYKTTELQLTSSTSSSDRSGLTLRLWIELDKALHRAPPSPPWTRRAQVPLSASTSNTMKCESLTFFLSKNQTSEIWNPMESWVDIQQLS